MTHTTPELARIIAAGVARYVESLPDFTRDFSAEPEPMEPNLTLSEAQQTMLCLSCALPDCVGVKSSACPIRQEQLRVWRSKH